MDLGVSGLASGFDWRTFVDKMVQVEQAPEQRLRADQDQINQRKNAYGSILTELGILSSRVDRLKSADLFSARLAQSSDSTVATTTAGTSAALGQYTVNVTQMATAASQQGRTGIGSPLGTSSDLSDVMATTAPLATAITAGIITINGKRVTIASTDSLADVFNNIAAATGNTVTASYDADSDRITLSSTDGNPIVLGSATDTSNFFQAAKLSNNGTGTITSRSALGAVRLTGGLTAANLAVGITDGGSGAGEFKINGVSISFSATNDSLSNVIDRINNSAAGVIASYDTLNNRLVLTNKTTGDMGIALEDTTGNFLEATGLTGGTLVRGQDLLYTINGGGQASSHSNVITPDSSGLAGLTVNVLKTGATTITVASDTDTIKQAITDFVDEFNKVQSLIDTQTASSTSAQGKVTAGTLANDSDADAIADQLRRLANGQRSNLAGMLKSLDDLGVVSNGNDNKINLEDTDKLADALANHLTDVQALFTDSTNGIATQFSTYLDKTIGDDGTLPAKQSLLARQAADIDTQIANMERAIQADRQRMLDAFTAMETAQAKINQQMSFLQQRMGIPSSPSPSSSSGS